LQDFVKSGYITLANSNMLSEVINEFSAGNSDVVNDKLFNLYNDNLQKGIRGVFKPDSSNYKQLDYLYKFDANAAKFAANKANYVGNVLRKAKEAKPEEFQANAKKILGTFNRFQITEYNTTVARCRTAKQFDSFLAIDKAGTYKNLEWIRTRSASPRELHLKIAGTVLPVIHPYWKENQPGNIYNCKCDWKLTNAPVTQIPDNVIPAKGLDKNPANTREIFTEEHPYYEKSTNKDLINEYLFKHVLKQFEKQENFYIHPLVHEKSDLKNLKFLASKFSTKEDPVYILPQFDRPNDLYNAIFNTRGVAGNKNVDLLFKNELWELKGFEGKWNDDKLSTMLSSAIKQSGNIILDLRGSTIQLRQVKKQITVRIERYKQPFKKVYAILNGDKLIELL
jgi:hypothetical protein